MLLPINSNQEVPRFLWGFPQIFSALTFRSSSISTEKSGSDVYEYFGTIIFCGGYIVSVSKTLLQLWWLWWLWLLWWCTLSSKPPLAPPVASSLLCSREVIIYSLGNTIDTDCYKREGAASAYMRLGHFL